jgi:polyhydroxybutyrate depolymerase
MIVRRAGIPLTAALLALFLVGCGGAAGSASIGGSPTIGSSTIAHSQTRASQGTGRPETLSFVSGGHERTYVLYVPPGDSAAHPLPLVLVYHGAGDTAANETTETDLLNISERRHDMILVYMQGYDDTWNEGAGHTPAERAGINDVAYTSAVLHQIESSYDVDRRRVAATGLSNGALLTELLGCKLAANLTLIVPVEGELPVSVSAECRPSRPITAYEVQGTADTAIPFGGGHFDGVGGGTTVLSAPKSALRWATLDRCAANARRSRSGNIVLSRYGACRDGVGVTLAAVQGGQHQWPPNFGQTLVRVMNSLSRERQALMP